MSVVATSRSLPRHIAIIMDGNGRWAKARGLPRIAGHRRGAEAARRAVEAAAEIGVPYLTLFGFSSENWRRPSTEIQDLMGLLRHYLHGEITELHRGGVRLKVIGELSRLAPDILNLIEHAEAVTRDNSRVTLTIALSYGGRAEIVAAVQAIAEEVASGDIAAASVDEECFSNFLLWQCAYSELFFTKTLWPDFSKSDLEQAIDEFCGRERRYGTSVGSH
jgi:undecaprenyl diphosphate synthase